MPHECVNLVHRWFHEVWNQRSTEVIDELVTHESVCHDDAGPIRGPAEFLERQYKPLISAFPDLRVNIDAVLCEGDQVVVRWNAPGTHRGPGLGCEPTQDAVVFRGITWIRVQDGKLIEGWQHSNIPDLIRGLAEKAAGRAGAAAGGQPLGAQA